MTMTFSRFSSRKDKALTGFQPTDAALLNEFTRAISCNATTGYVRVIGTAVYVPTFTADKIEAHLTEHLGWSRETSNA